MWIADNWKDYAVLDCGGGEKAERWGSQVLVRPDPQAIWPREASCRAWDRPNAIYHRSNAGGGRWEIRSLPEQWAIRYRELTFQLKPMSFKHTGLFPEQAANWDWMMDTIQGSGREDLRVLNLFAYTGGATMACASAGAAEVVHVDASKGMVNWAKENMMLSHLENHKIRFIVDDVLKFVAREKRRGRTYHAIIMDPPSYGRGPNGEIWKIEEQLYPLISACMEILDDDPLFFLVNSYTTGFPPTVLYNLLRTTVGKKHCNGAIAAGEIGLPITTGDSVLPCGIYGKWVRDNK